MFERALRAAWSDAKLHLQGVFSVAVAFICLGSMLLLLVNVDGLRQRFSDSGKASVYLRAGVDLETVSAVKAALLAAEGVEKVEYLSAEQARADVLANTTDEALAALPSEAFSASLEVSVATVGAAERLEKLREQLLLLPAVESVETYRAFGERLAALLAGGLRVVGILLVVVLFAAISVVGSSMRMALVRRKSEVEVLKMVGATDSYVRGPFVVEGAIQGGLGALLSVVVLLVLYLVLREAFDGALGTMLGVAPRFLPPLASLGLVFLGASIGSLASFLSLRRLVTSFV